MGQCTCIRTKYSPFRCYLVISGEKKIFPVWFSPPSTPPFQRRVDTLAPNAHAPHSLTGCGWVG